MQAVRDFQHTVPVAPVSSSAIPNPPATCPPSAPPSAPNSPPAMSPPAAFCAAQALVLRLTPRAASAPAHGRRALVAAAAGKPAAARRMPAVSRPLVPSRELQAFVPDHAVTRGAVLKRLSAYVKENGLQDAENKRMVNCDPALKALFGVESCTFLGMSKYVSPHLRKPEDVGGKYVEEARLVEQAWLKENADKPQAPKKVTKRKPVNQEEAKANGTGLWRPVGLSPDLAKVCGKKEMPRQEVIKAVWTYIRAKKLQSKPGEPVKCDALLKSVFKSDTITAREIMGGVSPHITKK